MSVYATPRVPAVRSSSVKVFVRTRPLLPDEEKNATNIVYASSTERQVTIEDGSEKSFHYDGVLEKEDGQDEVYVQAVAPLVAKVKQGCNATVLAYGQTGSGKTYTMGTCPYVSEVNEGVLQRALQEFLSMDENDPPVDDCLKSCSTPHQLKLSMVEIYSETVYDLLASKNELKIKNEIGGGASIVGLVEEHIDTLEKGLALLQKGTDLRSTGTTVMNTGSSRSHALVFLTVKHGHREGCLKLVDLAGAEGVGRAQSCGVQFTEGVNINKGLLCLGKVLAALSNSSGYVPYRESLLTRVLKDSLGGGSYTTMIACVNPSSNNINETINTLRYAEQARNIKMKIQAQSTIKKRDAKRRLDDVSASSSAWKKVHLSAVKADHNSTISTPGHKPPVRKLAPMLNNTVATPSARTSGLLSLNEQKHTFEIGKSLFPSFPPAAAAATPAPVFRCPMPSLTKNIFEDHSPGLSVISDIEEIKSSPPSMDSPFMDRITSRLETTMIAHLGNLEDRVADRIIAKLTKKHKGKQTRQTKKMMGKSICSTPTDDDSCSGTDGDSSCDNILEKTIAQALSRKNVLQEAVSSALGRFVKTTSETLMKNVADKTEVKPFSKLTTDPFEDMKDLTHDQETQVKSTFLQTPSVQTRQEYQQEDLPITSTAVCETRRARRSTRVATRISLYKAAFNTHSPQTGFDPEVTTCMNESTNPSFIGDVTVLQANATVIRANNDSLDFDSFAINTKCGTGEATMKQNLNTVNRDENSKPEKNYRRRSSRLEAVKATQRNQLILQDQSPFSRTTKKRRSCSKMNASLNRSRSTMRKAANTSMNASVSSVNHTMLASPRVQEEHNNSILKILNTGNLRELQQLPTIGPKTAMVISNFRKLYGMLSSIPELEKVPGISRNFYSRFTKANLVAGVPDQL